MATAAELRMLPGLVLILPYEMEGTHTLKGTDKVLYLDHHWDNTFGHAFGMVGAIAPDVDEVAPGDFVHFTRHAYETWHDEDGDKWLIANKDDLLAVITPGESEVDAKGVVETENRVDRNAA